MDKLAKVLAKMSDKDRLKIKALLILIAERNFSGLDFKKLVGRNDIYRVRQGNFRIIFRLIKNNVMILTVEKRSDTTYNL